LLGNLNRVADTALYGGHLFEGIIGLKPQSELREEQCGSKLEPQHIAAHYASDSGDLQ